MQAVDSPVFDADNHYDETPDAFTRHLHPKLGPRVVPGSRSTGRAARRGGAGSTGPSRYNVWINPFRENDVTNIVDLKIMGANVSEPNDRRPL